MNETINITIGGKYLRIVRFGRRLQVVEQKYRGSEFGAPDTSGLFTSRRSGFRLWSCDLPTTALGGFYVRGNKKSHDACLNLIPSEAWWNMLCIAVSEYNKIRRKKEETEKDA